MKLYLGIDPGLQGAAVVITSDRGVAAQWKAPKSGKEYVVPALVEIIQECRRMGVAYAAIEKSQAFPGNGARSAWKMGFGAGLWMSALAACKIPFFVPTPRMWQTAVGIVGGKGKDTKAQSIMIAHREFPSLVLRAPRCRKDDDNIADAALIALFAGQHATSLGGG